VERYGLIGYPLGHSFSPDYFGEKFLREGIDARYDAFPLERIEDFPSLLAAEPDLLGLNVTIPYKEAVLPYVHRLTPQAQAIGAVNCIAFRDGELVGHNTDWIGFAESLKPALGKRLGPAIVLGTGGGSKAVQYALRHLEIPALVASRTPSDKVVTYDHLTTDVVATHNIIINTTPLGMAPRADERPPLPYDAIGSNHLLFDLVYNPAQTLFLLEGARRGATALNGLRMLKIQAEAAWAFWQEGKTH